MAAAVGGDFVIKTFSNNTARYFTRVKTNQFACAYLGPLRPVKSAQIEFQRLMSVCSN